MPPALLTAHTQVQAQESERRHREVRALAETLEARMAAQSRLLLAAKEADIQAAVKAATEVGGTLFSVSC
jgi:hypothetical protein